MLENSKKLKVEADKLLSEWKLLDFLSKYGETYIVGSVVLDLMVWRDIDIEVIAENTPIKGEALEIAKYLFSINGVRKVSPIDYRSRNINYSDTVKPNKPNGLYVGAEYIDEGGNSWKIDVWYLTKNSANSKTKTDEILSKLDDANRKIIIDIKSQIYDNPNYRKNVTSVDVYEAVLDKNVTNFPEFKDYITDTKNIVL